MAAENYIQLPTDGSGKKARSVSKTVGGQEVHAEVFVPSSVRLLTGGAYSISIQKTTGAGGSGSAFYSFLLPASASRPIAIRKLVLSVGLWTGASALGLGFGPCLDIVRITGHQGGTDIVTTGASSEIFKKDSNYIDATVQIKKSPGGVTGPIWQNFFSAPCRLQTGSSIRHDILTGREDGRDDVILRPGEGIALMNTYTGSPNLVVMLRVDWEEFSGASITI